MKKMLGILAVMLLGASLTFAQTPDNANSDRSSGTATTQNGGNNNNNNRGHNWGWIGLLGLAGLIGRRGRDQATTAERNQNVTSMHRAA